MNHSCRLLTRSSDAETEKLTLGISEICIKAAQIAENHVKDSEKALSFLNEALHHKPKHNAASIALAKLYIKQQNPSSAQNHLNALLEQNPDSLEASELMADLMFNSASFQSAVFHYHKLLEKNPGNFEVLAKYIQVCKRIGKLELIEGILMKDDAPAVRFKLSPGYHYCRGLYFRSVSKLNDAMREFVLCKRDSIWGERTLMMMVDIFLNPGNETIGGDALEGAVDNSASATNLNTEAEMLGVVAAGRLLKVCRVYIGFRIQKLPPDASRRVPRNDELKTKR
jgi:tetratricopeptide repeat protein 21B